MLNNFQKTSSITRFFGVDLFLCLDADTKLNVSFKREKLSPVPWIHISDIRENIPTSLQTLPYVDLLVALLLCVVITTDHICSKFSTLLLFALLSLTSLVTSPSSSCWLLQSHSICIIASIQVRVIGAQFVRSDMVVLKNSTERNEFVSERFRPYKFGGKDRLQLNNSTKVVFYTNNQDAAC